MDMQAIIKFLRKLYAIYQVQRWERAARRALRDYDLRSAEFAIERINAISRG